VQEYIIKSIVILLAISIIFPAIGAVEDANSSLSFESRKEKAMQSFSEYSCISISLASDPNLLKYTTKNPISLKIYSSSLINTNALSELTTLRELVIANSGIKDISFVSKLNNLEHLNLAHNQITNLAPIANCKQLKILSIRDNEISDLTPLSLLKNIKRADVGKNPFADAHMNQIILKVRENNPSVTIFNNKDTVPDTQDILYAKGKYSAFCSTVTPVFDERLAGPFLPELPSDVLAAGQLLRKNRDLDYITETAILLMKFCNMKSVYYRPGGLFERDDFLVESLLKFFDLRDVVFGDDPSVGGVESWISENRDKFGPSVLLDLEIKKCEKIKQDEIEELRRLKEDQVN